MITEELKSQIVEALKPLDLEKIILFGSYAYGVPNEDSDIDLYIVTKDNFMPKNYEDNIEYYLGVSKFLRSIKKQQAVDLIVHTKAMHEKFIEYDSSFSREIMSNGVRLI